MIKVSGNLFALETKNTTYCFEKMQSGHLEHIYYGRKIDVDEESVASLRENNAFGPGTSIAYSKEFANLCLEDVRLEMGSLGKGDFREPFIEVIHADGSSTSDFLFEKYEIIKGALEDEGLPRAYDESGEYEHLIISLRDASYDLTLELHYLVYEECNVITRYSKLINESGERVVLKRLMSSQLDLSPANFSAVTFNGAWAREMDKHVTKLSCGTFVNSTNCGASSNRANPFVILGIDDVNENRGECFGFNLIYSGNHAEIFNISTFDKMRVLNGINPAGFSFVLDNGDSFVAPEAVLSFSFEGFNGLSLNMHAFVREHIVRGTWKRKERPVLLNSWEAAYFKINEKKLTDLASEAKKVGCELFVMDDGWFGERNDDTSSLGDWEVNKKKLPGGLKGLCEKIKALGLMFGIWVEPEMTNVKSKLFESHPDWTLEIPGKPHSEGRNQRVLDLTKSEVCDYVIDAMTKVFGSADISYVKWDMNRIYSDVYSSALEPDRQGETAHRYMLGLYRILRVLNERFPQILFEGCASGGNRFDLGMLCYFPQIWASDDTDAYQRVIIQNGYSYGYPLSVVSAHVSNCPNHQTLRKSPLDTRFNVAFFGCLGYEFNLCELNSKDKDTVKEQISLYKKWRELVMTGSFCRISAFPESNETNWILVSKDKTKAVGLCVQDRVVPNTFYRNFKAYGLDEELTYRFYNFEKKVDIREFGDLVNMISPVALKQDSLMMDIAAKFVKLDGEKEDYKLKGNLLMNAGVNLKQHFAGTGFDGNTAFYQDLGSRLYFMEAL